MALRRVFKKKRPKMAVDASQATVKELTLGEKPGKVSAFILTDESLYVSRPSDLHWPEVVAPLRQIAWAELNQGSLELHVLARKRKNEHLSLIHITGAVQEAKRGAAQEFVDAVMSAAYKGFKKRRHLLCIVNPKSGPGKSVSLFHKRIEPVFKAAKCTTEVIFTTHHKHAWEIAKSIQVDKYDAIVTVSGDGIVHEVLNGFAEHADPIRAFRIPIAPVPTGSGNALALNLLGLQDGFDVSAAALNAAKGFPMPVDLLSVTQGDNRVFSFMTQAIGLMSELDLGTEHLRFIGDSRFLYGYLRGVIQHRSCPVKVHIKVAESDKKKMVEDLEVAQESTVQTIHSHEAKASSGEIPVNLNQNPVHSTSTAENAVSGSGSTQDNGNTSEVRSSLPPLVHRDADTSGEGWVTFDKPVMFLFAGKGPLVARDLMQFPVSHPDDGYIDIAIQEMVSRKEMLGMIDGADAGRPFWSDKQHYYKAQAYRVETHAPNSYLAVDGEWYPFEPFEVEVHPKLATWLTPYGAYNAHFSYPPPTK